MGNRINRSVPADPEAEKAQLRQLTRELHEAAQDARDAARELIAARKTVESTAEDTIDVIVTKLFKEMENHLDEIVKAGEYRTDFQVDHITEITNLCMEKVGVLVQNVEARLAGYESREDLGRVFTEVVQDTVNELAKDKEFIGDVAEAVSDHMKFVLPGRPAQHAGKPWKVSPANDREPSI